MPTTQHDPERISQSDIIALQIPGQDQIRIAVTAHLPIEGTGPEVLEVPLDAARSSNQPFLAADRLLVITPETEQVRTAVVRDVHGPDDLTEEVMTRVAGSRPISGDTRVLVLEVTPE